MTRRNFIQRCALGAGGLAINSQLPNAFAADPPALPRPTPAQLEWQDCEVGVIYHFDLPIAAGAFASNNATKKRLDPNLYQPRALDTDQWVAAAKAAGARYALFTATHFNGFMQWQSNLYPYSLKHTSWRGGKADVVGDFVESCSRAGIKPGLYLSTHRNAWWTVWGHYVDWGNGRGTAKQAEFNRVAEKMVEELTSRYGRLLQIWFDAGVKTPAEGGPDVLPIFEKNQPDSVFYHNLQRSDFRWIGNESGYANDPCWATMPQSEEGISHNAAAWKPLLGTGDPNGTYWSPGMVDVPLRGANHIHSWFWAPNQDHGVEPVERLEKMYLQSVGRNCNFIIGGVINREGLTPQHDRDVLAAFGRRIKSLFGKAVAETAGRGMTLDLPLPRPQPIDHIVIMEDIAQGERIRRFKIEGLVSGDNWKELARAEAVGHKRILRPNPIEVAAIRLQVLESTQTPMIRRLAVFKDTEA